MSEFVPSSSSDEEWQPTTNELPELLEAPYEGDDMFIFERRLAAQIKEAPVEQRWDLAAIAKERIASHYPEQIGRLLFATTYLALAIVPPAEGEQSGRAYPFHNASISGEIKRINVLSLSDEQHHVAFELEGASICHTNEDTGEPDVFETAALVLVPIGAVTSHELL